MKKVGIITIEGNKNYGNKLQNYALQKVISDYGYEASTIFQDRMSIRLVCRKLKDYIYLIIKPNSNRSLKNKREKIFKNFTHNYLKTTVIKRKNIKQLDSEFDYYVIGSDQVWNPCVIDTYLGLEILNNCKRAISYAPSIAQTDVDYKFKEKIKNNFTKEKIPYISLREETGVELVKKVTARKDVKCVLDPTLLLDKNDWKEMETKPKYLNDRKFILCYFLGELYNSRKKLINEFAKENNCDIIDILNPKEEAYYSNPNEFLYLEDNAYAIFTDSFHSSVFGFIFDTPFFIFSREGKSENMSSRLKDFINKFKLQDRYLEKEKIENLIVKHDYKESYKILDNERKKSIKFLKKSLDLDDGSEKNDK